MKNIFKISVIFLFLFSFGVAQAQTVSEPVTFKVKVFFHCANGKALLESRLGALKGIESAVADLETKIVTIVHDPAVITQEKIIEMIEQIGYLTEFTDPNKPIKKACSHTEGEEGHDE